MDKEFYNLAVKLMDNIRQLEPNLVSARDAELCVLMTESQQIYAGITSVKISAGQLMRACPEYNAIMAMVPEGESRVLKLITVSFSHREVSQPCEGCLELLCRVNKANADTEIFIAANRSIAASELMPELVTDAPEVAVPAPSTAEAPESAEETASADAPAEETASADAPAEETASAETPAEETASADAPAEETASADAPAEETASADAPAEENASEDAPAEEEKPKDDFAQFGFEEAEGDFVTHVEIDKDNPFAESSEAAEAPKVMTPPPTMFDKPQSGYLDNPEQQSGYQQQSAFPTGAPNSGSLYASQPLPGQQQMGGAVFQPTQQQPFQPMQQPMQQQPYQQQDAFPQQQVYQQQGAFPQQPYQQQGAFPQQPYQQQGAFPQQQAYQQQGAFPQQPYQQQGVFPQQPMQQQSSQFQPNPQFQQSQQYTHYSHNTSQYQQSSQFQPNPSPGPQYASQPLPGSNYISQGVNGAMTATQPLPGSNTQTPAQKEAGSAFKERLNAYVEEDKSSKEKPLSKAEMMRQAKEKKKMAKIDADFKKQMKKKGL